VLAVSSMVGVLALIEHILSATHRE